MSQELPADHVLLKQIVFSHPMSAAVRVESDRPYRDDASGTLTMDIYRPPDTDNAAPGPCVFLVTGYPDPGARRLFGRPFKSTGAFTSWARALAAAGLTAICYENHSPNDLHDVIRDVTGNVASLNIDAQRLALWACSGHAPTALATLIAVPALKCAALFYPYTLDRAGGTEVADAAARFGFAPARGYTASDLPLDKPLFVARAGCDEMPGLNVALDALVSEALARDLPLTLTNHAGGMHAFDLLDNSATSRDAIRRAIRFLQDHLDREGGMG